MGGIFWSMVLDWAIIEIGFVVGVALAIPPPSATPGSGRRRAKENARAAAAGVHPPVQP